MYRRFFGSVVSFALLVAPSIAAGDEIGLRGAIAAESQAWWAAASFFVTVPSLLISALALLGLFISLGQTRKALAETRDFGRRQTRAYVEAISLELSVDDGDVVVVCQNSGETPSPFFAVGVEARRVRINTMAQALKDRPSATPRKTWAALGKGAQWRAKVTPDVGGQEVRQLPIQGLGDDERLLLTGVVIYEDIFGCFFKTEFAFFTKNGLEGQFLRPNGFLTSYKPMEKPDVSRLLGTEL